MQLLEGDPSLPDRLRPVQVLRSDVAEVLAGVVVQVLLSEHVDAQFSGFG